MTASTSVNEGEIIAVFEKGDFLKRDEYETMLRQKERTFGYAIDVTDDVVMDNSRIVKSCLACKANSPIGCFRTDGT